MIDISRKTYERDCKETIVNNDGMLWLNEKHVKKGLGHKNLWEITRKYHSEHRNHIWTSRRTKKNNVTEFL